MTEREALINLLKTKTMTTDLLEPLGLSMEWFLWFSQLDPKKPHRRKAALVDVIRRRCMKHFSLNPFISYGWSIRPHNRQR